MKPGQRVADPDDEKMLQGEEFWLSPGTCRRGECTGEEDRVVNVLSCLVRMQSNGAGRVCQVRVQPGESGCEMRDVQRSVCGKIGQRRSHWQLRNTELKSMPRLNSLSREMTDIPLSSCKVLDTGPWLNE